MLAVLLGVTAALVVSCGSSSGKLIPLANSKPLQSDFEELEHAAETGDGDCSATEEAIAKTEQDFGALPSSVDVGLREHLREGIAKDREDALALCAQALTQTTHTTSTAKTTPKTTITTTNTNTTTPSTATTQTTPPTNTSPTTGTSTSTSPSGGAVAPGTGESPAGSSGQGGGTGAGEAASEGAGAGASAGASQGAGAGSEASGAQEAK